MTKEWAKAAAIRAVRTVAQAAIAMIGTSVVLTDVDWMVVLSASCLAGVLSILTSVAGLPEVDLLYYEEESSQIGFVDEEDDTEE